jgi:hypothetical protein
MGHDALPGVQRSRKVALTAVIILGLGVGGLGSAVAVRAVMNHDAATADPTSKGAAVSNASAPPVAPATSLAPLPVAPTDTSSATKDAAAVVPSHATPPPPKKDTPPPATPPALTPPAQRVPTPPATPAAPAKNCSPNYYFDKDGNKHFKPECF